MSHLTNDGLMFERLGLDDVLVCERSTKRMQEPSTDGAVASSTVPTGDPESLHQAFHNVHQAGTCQTTNEGREEQCHRVTLLTAWVLQPCRAARPHHSAGIIQGPPNTADQLRSGAPVRLAVGGRGRHLSSSYGCRSELRQLHPLVRQPRCQQRPILEEAMPRSTCSVCNDLGRSFKKRRHTRSMIRLPRTSNSSSYRRSERGRRPQRSGVHLRDEASS